MIKSNKYGKCIITKLPLWGKFTLGKQYEMLDIDLICHGPGVDVFEIQLKDDEDKEQWIYNEYVELVKDKKK